MYTVLTLVGALSKTILALVIIPNCPKPPKTAKNSSEFLCLEQVTNSPLPEPKHEKKNYIVNNHLINYIITNICVI